MSFFNSAGSGLKIIRLLLAVCLFHAGIVSNAAGSARLNILTSFLPIYIFTKNVVGNRDGVEVACLLPPEADPHDYQMRPSDMKKVAGADLIIVNGLGIEDFLVETLNEGRTKESFLESSMGLPMIRAGNYGDNHRRHHGSEYNPHTWVSPEMAILHVKNIAEFMSKADPGGREEYMENAENYIKTLEELQSEIKESISAFSFRKIVTFHNAFDYLARDSGLEIMGVIYNSPGEEPSAGHLSSLIELMKKNNVRLIFKEPQTVSGLPDIVAKETGSRIYELDPAATGEFRNEYYVEAMRKNMFVLIEALGTQNRK